MTSSKYTIWDIDNCLSNDERRIKKIDWSRTNPEERYAPYHAECGEDLPGNTTVFKEATRDTTPIFLTARPCDVRPQTVAWLRRHFGATDDTVLMMRNIGDHRPAVEIKREQLMNLQRYYGVKFSEIVGAYDDRQDIVAMYGRHGIPAFQLQLHNTCAYSPPAAVTEKLSVTAADVLAEMAKTFKERNAVYGDNFKMVPKLMAVLFPNGVPPELVVQDQFHLFELVLVKLSRYAISNLTHIDSVHDLSVYGAMCEAINLNSKEPQ